MNAKKLNKIVDDRLTLGNNAIMNGISKTIRLTKQEDW